MPISLNVCHLFCYPVFCLVTLTSIWRMNRSGSDGTHEQGDLGSGSWMI